ncbi:MAG: hypothetical protein M0C28_08095 [Candidatus Moduliflexus flocculans]|nr:hypothetical protein [Candidatus Moduliflexus flocculans]
MKDLTPLEQMILGAIWSLEDDAYGVSIKKQGGRPFRPRSDVRHALQCPEPARPARSLWPNRPGIRRPEREAAGKFATRLDAGGTPGFSLRLSRSSGRFGAVWPISGKAVKP